MRALASILLPALLLASCGKSGSGATASNYTVDRTHAQDNHGQFRGPDFTTTAFWGKPFLMMRWSSDCATCEAQLANLDALAADGKIPVVILNNDPVAKPDALTPFVASHGYKSVHVVRATSDLVPLNKKDIDSNMFQALDPGMVLLFNSKIQEVWAMTGVADFKSADVQKLLAEAK